VSPPVSDNSHDVTERLVATNPENAPTAHPITPITRGQLLNTDFGPIPSSAAQITIRRRTASQDSAPEPSREEQLAQLQFAAAVAESTAILAEATARETAALEATETSRRNIQRLASETQDLARCTSGSTRSRSGSVSPDGLPPPSEFTTLMQLWQMQQQQAAIERREDDRRRDQRREDDRREDERRRADERLADRREAAATAAERETRLEAVIASLSRLQAPPAAPARLASTDGFKSNRSFEGVSVFSGDHGQSFRQWSADFMAKADIVGVQHDNLRELRLKLTGPAREYYDRQWAGTDEPALSVVLAYLSSEFGAKYEESSLFADYFQYKRKPGTPGKDVTRSLTNTRQKMHVAGMPVSMSAAEIQYYLHELSLSAKHRAIFLAQLSSRADVSDAHLKYLTGTPDGNRRESSFLTLTSSEDRTQLFEARLTLIIAYLEHDPGETGAARAATTSGTSDDTAAPTPTGGAPLPAAPPGDRAAVVAILQAQHTARGDDTDRSPPRYYGTAARPDLIRNAATFTERKTSRQCFGCTPAQLAAQGTIPHWACRYHGQDASDADRANRVPGSGPARLSDGPGKQHRR
jgi:hypothetical protein